MPDRISKPSKLITFLFLILPFGIVTGYLTVTLAFLFSKAGISIAAVAGLVAASIVPQMLKFIWAPLVDVTLSVKKWHVLATVVSAACILATGIIPVKQSSLPLLTGLIIVSNIAVSFVSIAVNTLSAYAIIEEKKGLVSGYVQAGYMGGTGVGGGLGLWLVQYTGHNWLAGVVLALICMLSCIGLFFVKEPHISVRVKRIEETMHNVLKDVWETLKTKTGLLALIVLLLPIGSCVASTLFAAIAKDWNASAGIVAVVTGITGGVVTGLGSLAGGWICDRMHKRTAYLIVGALQILTCLGLCFCRHTPAMYITWTLLYAATSGMCYASYNALTLHAIGKGAAATKFEIYASISNVPLYLMTFIEGIAYTKWGATGMLQTEAGIAFTAIGLFILIQWLFGWKKSMIAGELAR